VGDTSLSKNLVTLELDKEGVMVVISKKSIQIDIAYLLKEEQDIIAELSTLEHTVDKTYLFETLTETRLKFAPLRKQLAAYT